MAPRRCHLEPIWLQEPIFIDFGSIFQWFWNGFLRYILIDIVTRLRSNLDSFSREDVKTRSCGVAKAWRREAVLKMAFVTTFEEAVQGVCALWHFTLLHIALLCLAPCMDMHGFTLVYIYIYIYTYTHPHDLHFPLSLSLYIYIYTSVYPCALNAQEERIGSSSFCCSIFLSCLDFRDAYVFSI